ncbi:hypothetical protein COY95_01310, partial [Candidatus Woesearchaeota archaeon CG_4_10_14_0_8_um_filter_47_5]
MFSGWVLSGDSVTLKNRAYVVSNAQDLDKVIVRGDAGVLSVSIEECGILANYKFCYLENRFDLAKGYGAYDYARDRKLYENSITVYDLTPELKITHTSSSNTIAVKDEITVIVNITNNGEDPAYNVTYELKLQPWLRLTSADPRLTTSGGRITRTIPFLKKSDTFSFKVTLDLPKNSTLQATAEFLYKGLIYNMSSSQLKVNYGMPQDPLAAQVQVSPTKTTLGQNAVYTLTLTNTNLQEPLEVTQLRLVFDPELSATPDKKSGLISSATKVFTWSGELPKNTSKEFSATIFSPYTGDHDIRAYYTYTFYEATEEKTHTLVNNKTALLSVSLDELKPHINISRGVTTLESNEDSTVSFTLELRNDLVRDFKYLNYRISGGVIREETGMVPDLTFEVPVRMLIIRRVPFTAPWVDKETKIPLNFTGSYQTQAGERFYFDKSTTITVKPQDTSASLGIFYATSDYAEKGTKFTINVIVRNIEHAPMQGVAVTSEVPGFRIEGENTTTTTLSPDSKKTVLSYKALIPFEIEEKNLTIVTLVTYLEKGNRRQVKKSITIPVVNSSSILGLNETLN